MTLHTGSNDGSESEVSAVCLEWPSGSLGIVILGEKKLCFSTPYLQCLLHDFMNRSSPKVPKLNTLTLAVVFIQRAIN